MDIERMIKLGEKFGEIEIYHLRTRSLTARYVQDYIETGISRETGGFGLRLVVNGAIGFSFFNRPSEFRKALEKARKMAKLMPKEGYELPEPKEPKEAEVYSEDVASLGFEDLVQMLEEAIAGIKRERAKPMQGEINRKLGQLELASSTGTFVLEKSTSLDMYVSAKRETGTGYDFHESRALDLDPRELGRNAGKDARLSSQAKKAKWEGLILIHPDVLAEFLNLVLARVDGEAVRRGKSPWAGKLGQRVTGKISLIEDPWAPFMPGTCGFDDEGIPTRKKYIIRKGKLETFLYDTRTANLAKTETTGNGFRAGYASLPGIEATNLLVGFPERESLENLDNYLLVKSLMGYHNMNSKTGDFSLTLDLGFLVKEGREMPVRGGLFIDNVFELLERVELATEEELRRGSLISPYLAMKGRVTG